MKRLQKTSIPNRHLIQMRWAAKRADLDCAFHENKSAVHARRAVEAFVASAQLRAEAERSTGEASRASLREAFVKAEHALTSLEIAQRHSTKAREKKIRAAQLRFIVCIEELDADGGASGSTDAPLTRMKHRSSLTYGLNAISSFGGVS